MRTLLILVFLGAFAGEAHARIALDASFGRNGVMPLSLKVPSRAGPVAVTGSGPIVVATPPGLAVLEPGGRRLRNSRVRVFSMAASGGRVAVLAELYRYDCACFVDVVRILGRDGAEVREIDVPAVPGRAVRTRQILRHPRGGWLLVGFDVLPGRTQGRQVHLRISRDGRPGGWRVVNRGPGDVAVDRRGRTLHVEATCGRRGRFTVRRMAGRRADPTYRSTPVPGRYSCAYSQVDGMAVDQRGRLLLALRFNHDAHVVRLGPEGGVDRSFADRGRLLVDRGARPTAGPVPLPGGGFAIGVATGGDIPLAAVLGVSSSGRVTSRVRTRRARGYPLTLAEHLVPGPRGSLVMSGFRSTNDDDPFYTREDYATQYPAVWRFRIR